MKVALFCILVAALQVYGHSDHGSYTETLEEIHHCGTAPLSPQELSVVKWRQEHIANTTAKFGERALPVNSKYRVVVKNFISRNSAGQNSIDPAVVINEFGQYTNPFYANSNFQFVLEPIEYITSDALYNYNGNYNSDNSYRSQYAKTYAVNIFWTKAVYSSGTEVCGYAYFPFGTMKGLSFMSSSCVKTGTLAHELGHAFGLPHTHDSQNGRENVDGSNCGTAGDAVCDTPADPTLSYSTVDSSCRYTGSATDAKGQRYAPDPKNLMSYSRKECRTVFTEGQFAKQRNDAEGIKDSFIQTSYTHTTATESAGSSKITATFTATHTPTSYSITIPARSLTATGASKTVTLGGIPDGTHDVQFKICYSYTVPETGQPYCETYSRSLSFTTCTRTTSCAAKNFKCGSVFDGCSNENCGNCPSGQTCDLNSGQCICTPTDSCAARGYKCGTVNTGCGTETCGTCASGVPCTNGVCESVCTPTSSCSSVGKVCGQHWNGCNYEQCSPGCTAPNTCNDQGQCVCTSVTCAQAGKNCGEFWDGCKTIQCGNCTNGDECNNNVCGCSPSTTCEEQGWQCGILYDGCGFKDCGPNAGLCPENYECSEFGRCECTPKTDCFRAGKQCGTLFDGCSLTVCGGCGTGSTCNENTGTCESQCTPTTDCAKAGYECGTLFNGCETINCAACSGSTTCNSNTHKCECTPVATCAQQGRNCGSLDTGCGVVNCGACPGFCFYGQCWVWGDVQNCSVPTTTCEDQGKQCGTIFNGCQEIGCGACNGSRECVDGVCQCKPSITCEGQKRECGRIHNGCEEISCGFCGDEQRCNNGTGKCETICIPHYGCEDSAECGRIFDGCKLIECGTCREGQTCENAKCIGEPISAVVDEEGGSNNAAIIGGVAGGVGGLAVAGAVAFVIIKKKRNGGSWY